MENSGVSINDFKKEVLKDYKTGWISRNLSISGRKEVLGGRAKFGIFGDGKELVQLALARCFNDGDWRAGYYRDQTFMLAAGLLTPEQFFAQLYGDTDIERNPSSSGRQMNNHFATRSLDKNRNWKNLTKQKNSSPDISCTAGQMPRLLGLAYASKLFKENEELHQFRTLSNQGTEVALGTIGDASTSEGHFWETINAAGVLGVPMVVAIYDDGYGISVPKKLQTTKESISELLTGFEKTETSNGIKVLKAKGWDIVELYKVVIQGFDYARQNHVPVVFHFEELTQPLGHSTSGSHERYKSPEQLDWERNFDCLKKMREWILAVNIATELELDTLETEAVTEVKEAQKTAYLNYRKIFETYLHELKAIVETKQCQCTDKSGSMINKHIRLLESTGIVEKREIIATARKIIRHFCLECPQFEESKNALTQWLAQKERENDISYSAFLYPARFDAIKSKLPEYGSYRNMVNGNEILRANFDALLEHDKRIVIFGEDSGKLGDVNQGLTGLQAKHGDLRITDTGIREASMVGQAIGLALRGLRPIVEIQYLDYLLYALQTLSDDLATLSWRSAGGQVAPVIVRTRGHRLEGVWHSGSPMSLIINALRGVAICVPRNMTCAAAFYNGFLKSEIPAIIIEPLNGYRNKEQLPVNLTEFTITPGIPEVLETGTDITIVTYGACVKIAQEAIEQLKTFHVSAELIDVLTLIPFDTTGIIAKSIQKTSRIIFFDEDVPGGATAYMMQKVLEDQKAFFYLDAAPATLTGKEHRPAYGSDGDYFSNPSAEDLFALAYKIMHESSPERFPKLY